MAACVRICKNKKKKSKKPFVHSTARKQFLSSLCYIVKYEIESNLCTNKYETSSHNEMFRQKSYELSLTYVFHN